jgi:hypothetical protein
MQGWPMRRQTGLARFATVRGGGFFLPGRSGLVQLAKLQG